MVYIKISTECKWQSFSLVGTVTIERSADECQSVWSSYWVILGAVILMTAIAGWCPISALLGISTCRMEEEIPADTTASHEDREIPDRRYK